MSARLLLDFDDLYALPHIVDPVKHAQATDLGTKASTCLTGSLPRSSSMRLLLQEVAELIDCFVGPNDLTGHASQGAT
jgi:hypothetical protein